MEMLIFFFISLFAGVLAAYYSEHFSAVSKDAMSFQPTQQEPESIISRLLKISRQIH